MTLNKNCFRWTKNLFNAKVPGSIKTGSKI